MTRDTTTPITGRASDPFGLVGVRLENKYDIEAVVAEGGFGVVYRAVHRALQKAVAVKVLKVPEGLSQTLRREFLEKFAQEARIVAQFEHPAIVRVLDFGASPMPRGESAPWMVLEWLHGITLEQDFASRRGAGRSPAEVLALLQPVMEAIAYAHDEGVAHRDIKPGNVMLVANRRGEVSVKLLDFGIAKSMGRDEHASTGMTATRGVLTAFSPLYAAPEQLSGARTGPWTDVHAMGLLISEALVGAPVYTQDDSTALYAEALSPLRPTPAKFGLDVGAWETVLQQALAIRPDRRFDHMRTLLTALTGALDEQTALYAAPAWRTSVPPRSSLPPSTAPSWQADLEAAEWEGATRVDPSAMPSPYASETFADAPAAAWVGRVGEAAAPGAPAPSTFLPVAHTAPRVEDAPAARWGRVAAIVGAGAAVGVLAFALGLGRSSPPDAPITPRLQPLVRPVQPATESTVPVPPVQPPPRVEAAVESVSPSPSSPSPEALQVALPTTQESPPPRPVAAPRSRPPAVAVSTPVRPRAAAPPAAPPPTRPTAPPPPALAPVPETLTESPPAPVAPRESPSRAPRRALHHTEVPLQ